MRDILVLAIVLGSMPICFFYPYFGVLMWSWVAYFSPHRYAFGMAYHFPVAEAIAVPTLVGMLFTRDLNKRIFTKETVLVLLLWGWLAMSLLFAANEPKFAGHIADGVFILERISKILLMTVVTMLLVTSEKKLKYLYLVTALSFGFLAVKGTLFGLRTGGMSRVWGPPDSFITDNNDMALAMNMSLPLLFFMARTQTSALLKYLLRFVFLCGIVCVVLTYSRGGLLGLGTVLTYLAIKSHRRVIAAVMLVACVCITLTFAPPQWMARMKTISEGTKDETAHERVIAWGFAWNLAKDYPLMGGGLESFIDVPLFHEYAPENLPNGWQASSAHSIYFEVLGEAGFVGLGLFLALLIGSLLSTRRLRKRARGIPGLHWMENYANMVDASLIGFIVSGAFLSRPYFDFFFLLIASITIMKCLYQKELRATLLESEVESTFEPPRELALT